MRFSRRLTPAAILLCAALALSACKSAEERAEEYYQDALALIAEGDIDRAIVELRNVFDLDGGHLEARRTMAELQLQRGNRQAAYRQYLYLAEQDPDDLDSRIILSEMAFLGGNWEEVERHGARAEELAPDNPEVQVITLVRDYRALSLDKDVPALREQGRRAEEMLAEQPGNVLLHNVLMDHAIRNQDFERALEEIDWVIEYDPGNGRNYQERLRILTQLGDMQAVEAQLREMIELFPDNPTHKATLIRLFLSQQDLDAAETFLRDLAAAAEPDNPAPTLDLIRFLAELRSPEAAKAEIDKAVAEYPDPAPFLTFSAGLDFSQGRQDAAITTLEDLLRDAEPSQQTNNIKVALARMLLATGNEVGARARVEEVLADNDSHPEALKMQAAWQIRADETDAAISALRIALDQAPDDAQAMTLLAGAYERAGQIELMKDLLAQAVEASGNAPTESLNYTRLLIGEESYLPAEDILLDALRLDRNNIQILAVLGDLYLKMEDYGRAEGVARALRNLEDERATQVANAIDAERLNRQRGVEEAIAFLETLSGAEDATLATRITLMRAKLNTGDVAGALKLAQNLKQDDPDNASLDIVLAVIHALNGDLDTAIALYRDLLSETPERPQLWLELSRLLQQQGDREASEAAIEEGLSHSPDAPDLLWARASLLEQDGEIDEAIAIYETLYAQNSSTLVISNNLASLLATYRDDEASLERAWTIARRFRGAEPPPLQDTYGWILHRRGQSEEALPYLESAAEALSDDPVVQYHLGQVYVALNRPEEALEQFRKATEIAGPVDTRPQIETARSMIRNLESGDAPGD